MSKKTLCYTIIDTTTKEQHPQLTGSVQESVDDFASGKAGSELSEVYHMTTTCAMVALSVGLP
jgi:hypothetical protein